MTRATPGAQGRSVMATKRTVNSFTADGARELADRIATYWKARGYDGVKAWVELAKPEDGDGHLFSVRTNLVGGLPPRE